MLDLLKRCFKDQVNTEEWQTKLKAMIPSYGQSLANNAELLESVREKSSAALQLKTAKHVTLEVK
jgi:malate dehydrogenase (quinone)